MGHRSWTSVRESGSYRFLTSLRDRSQSLLSSGDILCFNELIPSTFGGLSDFWFATPRTSSFADDCASRISLHLHFRCAWPLRGSNRKAIAASGHYRRLSWIIATSRALTLLDSGQSRTQRNAPRSAVSDEVGAADAGEVRLLSGCGRASDGPGHARGRGNRRGGTRRVGSRWLRDTTRGS